MEVVNNDVQIMDVVKEVQEVEAIMQSDNVPPPSQDTQAVCEEGEDAAVLFGETIFHKALPSSQEG